MHHDFDSLRVTFHPVVIIGLGKNLLFKSVLAHCGVALGLTRNGILFHKIVLTFCEKR